MKHKNIFVFIFSLITLLAAVYYIDAWTEPTGSMPSTEDELVNIGESAQTKMGELSATVFSDADNSSYYINPSSSSLVSGDVESETSVTAPQFCIGTSCISDWNAMQPEMTRIITQGLRAYLSGNVYFYDCYGNVGVTAYGLRDCVDRFDTLIGVEVSGTLDSGTGGSGGPAAGTYIYSCQGTVPLDSQIIYTRGVYIYKNGVGVLIDLDPPSCPSGFEDLGMYFELISESITDKFFSSGVTYSYTQIIPYSAWNKIRICYKE